MRCRCISRLRDARRAQTHTPRTKRFAGLTVDDANAVLVGRETILRNGAFAGYLTSGGFGYTLGQPVGYGYVRHAGGVDDRYLLDARYELVIANEAKPARIGLGPFYDPANARVKA